MPAGGRYPHFVLAVLIVVYVFNFLDRQILSILAERITSHCSPCATSVVTRLRCGYGPVRPGR